MKLFKTVKVIKSKEDQLHFKRFAIIESNLFNIYIHKIYKPDEDKHLHDHPWNYFSVILKGFFFEETHNAIKKAKWMSISKQSATRFHKILSLGRGVKCVTTLFITGPRFREWGYSVDNKWIDNVTYRQMKNNKEL